MSPVNWVPFPVTEVIPALVSETLPPRDTLPPPERPVPAVTVIEELTSDPLPILVKVLDAPEMVLLVNVCAWFSNTKVSLALKAGIVATLLAPGAVDEMVVVLVVPKTN
jgi:hypothetical protein